MDIYPRTVPDAAHVVDNDGSLVKTLPPTAKLDQWQLRDLVGPTRSWTMVRGIRLIIDVLPIEVCSRSDAPTASSRLDPRLRVPLRQLS